MGDHSERAAHRWQRELREWGIPQHIVDAAPASPWVHSVTMFMSHDDDPADTPSMVAAAAALTVTIGRKDRGTLLDVGCGGGRSSLPLAPLLESVVGVDEHAAMLDRFAGTAAERAVLAVTLEGRWPDVAAAAPLADVVVCHHVVYNVGDIEPFVVALDGHARRRVVVELTALHPQHPLNPLWQHFWGIERPDQPSAELFFQVVQQLGRRPQLVRRQRGPRPAPIVDTELIAHLRQRLCLSADRDDELAQVLGPAPLLSADEVCTVWWDTAPGELDAIGHRHE